MGISIPVLVIIISLHVIAFVLAVGAERRRSTAIVVPDKYDEQTYCLYGTDASTVYGLTAFGLLLISQTVVNGVTKCLCFGRGMMGGGSTTCAVFFFIFSWVSFLGAEACLLAGSARNAYHTKCKFSYRALIMYHSPEGCICSRCCSNIIINDGFYPVLLVPFKG